MNKKQLSEHQESLVEIMQSLNFGRIEDLPVHAGQPVLAPPPRVIREVKFGGDNGPRLEVANDDFELKAQVRELFAQMKVMGNGVIRCLEVKHGLPFRMTIEENAA